MTLTELRPGRTTTASGPGFAYLMTGTAIACICISGVFGSIFTPDLVSGTQQEHTPIAAFTGWIFDVIAIGMVLPLAVQGIRAKVTERAPWAMLGLGVSTIWLAVMFISIFTPDMVTGTDPTRVPIAGMIAAIAGLVLTGLLCKTVRAASFEPADGKRAQAAAPPNIGPEPEVDDEATKLRRLAQLRDAGVITEEEFKAKKDDLLSRI